MAIKNKKQDKEPGLLYDKKISKKTDCNLQEMVALARRLDVMENQIFQLAENIGVQLKA